MKKLATVMLVLSVLAAIIMFWLGSTSGHLSELKDFFWAPLPLAVICLIIILSKKKN